MAFSEFEFKRIQEETARFIESNRPPSDMRNKLDLGFTIENQSIILYEIRPRWNKPEEILHHPFAKATFSKAALHWKVYWRRADLKWHRYDPDPFVDQLIDFLDILDEDKSGCFWG